MGLKFDLKRSGFPIEVAGVEFFFGTSTEELRVFFIRQQEYEAKRREIEKRATELVKSTELDENDPKYVVEMQKELDKATNFTKELATNDYDSLLGEGAFEKIYEAFPDLDKLANVFDDIAEAVADSIIEDTNKRADEYSKKRAAALKKKTQKRKNNKK